MAMRMIGFLWLPSFVKSTRISDEEWHVTPLKTLESSGTGHQSGYVTRVKNRRTAL